MATIAKSGQPFNQPFPSLQEAETEDTTLFAPCYGMIQDLMANGFAK